MSSIHDTFATAIGCMDGRVQEPIMQFAQQKFGVQYVDTITEAGIVGILAKEHIDNSLLEALNFKIIRVSLEKHHSKGIIVHGHQECAGNPVRDEKQKDDIKNSVKLIGNMVGKKVQVIGVFVYRDKDIWETEELSPLSS